MLAIKFRDSGRAHWEVGQPPPLLKANRYPEEVIEVDASEDELYLIQIGFSGLPRVENRPNDAHVRWTGDHAAFIAANIHLVRSSEFILPKRGKTS